MHRLSRLSPVLVFALIACGDDGGMSSGTGGSTSLPPPGTGGASGGGGIGPVLDAAAGGAIDTGGETGAGGVVDAPIGVGGGAGGVSRPSGTGGAPLSSGTGGVSVIAGTGGAPADGGAGGGTLVTPDAGSGVGPEAGSAGTLGCDKDLSGTWDLFATSVGTGIVRGTLVVAKEGFTLSTSRAQLIFKAEGTLSATWTYAPPYYKSSTRVISVRNTPAAADTGSFPIAIAGQWILQSNTQTCTLDVAAAKITGRCTGRPNDHNVGGSDWPWEIMPSPENGLMYTIARNDALASQFGDFGGNWTAQSDTGSGQGCSITLAGNTAATNCRASNSFNGALHLTIGADCVASGVTPSGLEVSARRR